MGTKISEEATGSDLLVCFRTAYLKAIAMAWQNKCYKEVLMSGRNVLEWSGFLRYMAGNDHCFGHEFEKTEEGGDFPCINPQGVKKLPWSARVTMGENENGPIFERAITAGWMGSNDHFIIVIPPRPDDPADFPAAIAAYLQQFPTLLGYQPELATESSNRWDFNAGEKGFLAFNNLLALAIPFCWANMSIAELRQKIGHRPIIETAPIEQQSFISLLTTHNFNTNGFWPVGGDTVARGANLLSTYFGFNNPWNFNFCFLDAQNLNEILPIIGNERSTWDARSQRVYSAFLTNGDFLRIEWDPAHKAWRNLFNVIDLNVPRNPLETEPCENQLKKEDQLVTNVVRANALALYNDSMSHYPFSCP